MEVITSIVRLSLALLLIKLFNFNIEGILLAFFIATLIPTLIMFKELHLYKFLSLSYNSWRWFKDLIKYGYPLSLALISMWLLSLANRYLIGIFRGSEEVGLYSVSSSLSEKPLTMIFSVLMLAAYPIIISVWERNGKEETEKLLYQLSRYYFLICLPLVIIISILSKEIILILSTPKYEAGHIIIPFIASGIFFLGLSQYVAKGFELKKKTYITAIFMFSAGLINIILSIILIPIIGLIGAGLSSMVSYFSLFLLFKWKVKSYLKWSVSKKSVFIISIATTLMGITLIFLKWFLDFNLLNLILIIFIGITIYFSSLFIFGEIKDSESKAIKSFLTNFFNLKKIADSKDI